MHHGDIGYLLIQFGKETNNLALIEFGKKLRETDRQDEDKWIFPDRKTHSSKSSMVKVPLKKKDDQNPDLLTIKLLKRKPQV